MHEIMVIKEGRLKLFQVDDDTLAKLTRIRGNFYQDNPRLILLKDMPTSSPAPVYSPEAIAATEKAFALYRLTREAGERSRATAIQPQPKPMTFEEQIQHDWRFNPSIRKEFISLTSYEAYCRAVQAGRAKCYGRG